MQDVGIACLSPGFVTHDPAMQEQVQKSIELREQQRKIIESRLHKSSMKSHVEAAAKEAGSSPVVSPRPLGSLRRKGPPPGLSITAPSAHQFASEPRAIQSAPLNHSFTGLRPSAITHTHPLSRQILDHTHHTVPIPSYTLQQNDTRLPPIHDVFNSSGGAGLYAPIGVMPSPGCSQRTGGLPQPGSTNAPSFPSSSDQTAGGSSSVRGGEREFRSADEAIRSLSGGREPKLVHYGGHQPPTPPSPLLNTEPSYRTGGRAIAGGRRRTREEFEEDQDEEDEDDGEPGRHARGKRRERETRRSSGEREREGSNSRKKDEFMALCARAWDLFHS